MKGIIPCTLSKVHTIGWYIIRILKHLTSFKDIEVQKCFLRPPTRHPPSPTPPGKCNVHVNEYTEQFQSGYLYPCEPKILKTENCLFLLAGFREK